MWNFERSGKMKVLAEIMKKWKAEGHRALIFVQTIQMLNVLQGWMNDEQHAHLRIDGHTAVKKRLKMIDEFNANSAIFAMLLTTRVGGVGLNIVGANRVVIFDPDWNPMVDVQARERAWRIGQKRDVVVYRLVLSRTVEEKIYQRQVYKHFLAQKVLNDPRQRQFFKWNDLAELFEIPPPPPNFSPEDMAALREKYKGLFAKLNPEDWGGQEGETTEVMQSIQKLPEKLENKPTAEQEKEHGAILETLYDSNGIKATFNHDKVEQPLLDKKIVRDGANEIAQRALQALQRSGRERSSQHISVPTWTGQRGKAGAVAIKREPKQEGLGARASLGSYKALVARSGASQTHVLDGLKQLAAIRKAGTKATQADEASRLGLNARAATSRGATGSLKAEPGEGESAAPSAIEGDAVGLPIELHASDKQIAQAILTVFLDPKLAGKEYRLTTGQVLEHLAKGIAPHHMELFKTLLKQMCVLAKGTHPSEPGCWSLRPEFWPGGAAVGS